MTQEVHQHNSSARCPGNTWLPNLQAVEKSQPMDIDVDMDLKPLLLAISEELDTNNLQSLKFLCMGDITPKEHENIREAKDLFLCLQDKGLLGGGEVSFLKELFFRIKRMDLLKRKLGTSKEEMETVLLDSPRISPYRQALFSIAQSLTSEQVASIKFLLHDRLPRKKMENSTMFDILMEMEKSELLGEHNTDELKKILKRVNRNDLLKTIEHAEARTKALPQQASDTEKSLPTHQVQPRGEQLPQAAELGETYSMERIPHGYCLIVNNYDFSQSQHKRFSYDLRRGTLEDGESLTKVFRRLRFMVEERRDLTAHGILQALRDYGTKNHTGKDCFVCCILSHGSTRTVYGTDGLEVPIKELTACFNGQACLSLAGKPKVFFIQACQGNKSQGKVHLQEDSNPDYESDASPMASIPDEADFLIGMATVEDYESYRRTQVGSVYIQSLCRKLEALCPQNTDIITILTEVNRDVATEVLDGNKQMPEIKSTLRKKLIFPVPLAEEAME